MKIKFLRASVILLTITIWCSAASAQDVPANVNRIAAGIPVNSAAGFGRMNIDQFLSQGIGFANIYYGDIEPDFASGYKYGISGYYQKPDTTYPASDK